MQYSYNYNIDFNYDIWTGLKDWNIEKLEPAFEDF